MRFLPTFLVFGGYMLVYAAVAAGGKFATEPWAGLFADAYTESTDPSANTKSGAVSPGTSSPQSQAPSAVRARNPRNRRNPAAHFGPSSPSFQGRFGIPG